MHIKYKSRRFLITLWAIFISSFIMVASIASKYTEGWLSTVLPLLVAIPSVYIAGTSLGRNRELGQTTDTQRGT